MIHEGNGGLSDARNAGMAAVTGEYIGFVDNDDWIEIGIYHLLYEWMGWTQSDIEACSSEMGWRTARRRSR